jgi:hypoxanthine phosphoribosyltransferase
MPLDIIALIIKLATATITAGCISLIWLTARNLHSASNSKIEEANTRETAQAEHRSAIRSELTRGSLPTVAGNTKLLKALKLPTEMRPSILVDGARLSSAAASIGFSSLEIVIQQLQQAHEGQNPYLFGVNRGGGLLANLLSDRLNLDQKYLVRCDYRPKWKKVICEHRPDVGFAIIIDDAVRTGQTLAAVKSKLTEIYPNAKIFVLALVMSSFESESEETQHEKLFDLVDYYPWITYQKHIMLPWSNSDTEDSNNFIDEDGVNQLVGRLLSHTTATEPKPSRQALHGRKTSKKLPKGLRISLAKRLPVAMPLHDG